MDDYTQNAGEKFNADCSAIRQCYASATVSYCAILLNDGWVVARAFIHLLPHQVNLDKATQQGIAVVTAEDLNDHLQRIALPVIASDIFGIIRQLIAPK